MTPSYCILVLLLLAPWPHLGIRQQGSSSSSNSFAAAQGLISTETQLGASEQATADQLAALEDLLDVSEQFTGGRGGGRGGSRGGRRGGAAFADTLSFRQLQLATYNLAGSPAVFNSYNRSQNPGGVSLLPRLRDQGSCSSCVAHAVAAAVEASIAATLQRDAASFDVSAPSLYYCSEGGRTCATGWTIAESLFEVKNNPGLVRPSACFDSAHEPEVGSWSGGCTAAAAACPSANASLPWMTCSYKALSSFWQIQQHLRQHGAVVTRMAINSDFRPFFDPTKTGAANGVYNASAGAKPLYGHAAIIVGYDNNERSFTMLNSWGTQATSDGLFRIAMGVAGVGAPDDTWGLTCTPAPGVVHPVVNDAHFTQPWKRLKRKPVRLSTPEDRTNLDAACHLYDAVVGDTPASIADAFLLDIRLLVEDNPDVFKLVPVNVTFEAALQAAELANMLNTVRAGTAAASPSQEPYFVCPTPGAPSPSVTCHSSSGSGVAPCVGLPGCALVYWEHNVSVGSLAGTTLRICGISSDPGQFGEVAFFTDASISQPRALRALLNVIGYQTVPVVDEYCSPAAWSRLADPTRGPFFQPGKWVTACDGEGYITGFYLDITGYSTAESKPDLGQQLVDPLLMLERLQSLTLVVNKGQLAPQFGALSQMKQLTIVHFCLSGPLPPNWGIGWPDLQQLLVYPHSDAQGQLDPIRRRAECGITGSLPVAYSAWTKLINLQLFANRLSGRLPPEYAGMQQLFYLLLDNNELTGELPATWAAMPHLNRLGLALNRLQGFVPATFMQAPLSYLNLDGNSDMQGCLPLQALVEAHYESTRISGPCSGTRLEVEVLQRRALNLLPLVLNAAASPAADAAERLLNSGPNAVSMTRWVPAGLASYTYSQTSADGGDLRLGVAIIEGTTFVTSLTATWASLNMTLVPELLAGLPMIDSFICEGCSKPVLGIAGNQLPASLAAKAPASLKLLRLSECNLVGTIPPEFGAWQTLERLDLYGNRLDGPLPPELSNMASLKQLRLQTNNLGGTLPDAWGSGPWSKTLKLLNLQTNPGLVGSIPSTWATLQAAIFIGGTGIRGCLPDQLWLAVYWYPPFPAMPRCSSNSSEVAALLELRKLLNASGQVLASWDAAALDLILDPGFAAPAYCRTWQGITCDAQNRVTSINLSGLALQSSVQPVSLADVLVPLQQLPGLQALKLAGNAPLLRGSTIPAAVAKLGSLVELNLAGAGLAGPLPPALAALSNLQHLNLSNNPDITGSIPEIYAGLTSLVSLDLSSCSLAGSLPAALDAMQQLEVLNASTNKLSGPLPLELGLLQSLRVLDLSNQAFSGSLPARLCDTAAMAGVAARAVASARQKAAAAASQLEQHMREAGDVVAATSDQQAAGLHIDSLAQASLQAMAAAAAAQALEAAYPQPSTAVVAAAASSMISLPLATLKLSRNKLGGSIPASLSLCRQLQELVLAQNSLVGSIPRQLAQLTQLRVLDASSNKLTSSLPAALAALTKLQQLNLSANAIAGQLPAVFIGMRSLQAADLGNNLLGGTVPLEFGFFADRATHALTRLVLSNNPCMNSSALVQSLQQSGITQGGWVAVQTNCCSAAANKNKKLCTVKKVRG